MRHIPMMSASLGDCVVDRSIVVDVEMPHACQLVVPNPLIDVVCDIPANQYHSEIVLLRSANCRGIYMEMPHYFVRLPQFPFDMPV